ncbi:MAG: tyrosine-type recombinase/integrase [Sporolactobacillus sp.]
MTKKKRILTIDENLSDVFMVQPRKEQRRDDADRLTIDKALAIVTRQMQIGGLRDRTIDDYNLYVNRFKNEMDLFYLDDITADAIFAWLDKMAVSPQTKLTRLKCLKAFLSRCFDNTWITTRFWKRINVKVDSHVKEGATQREIDILLSLLDLGDFVQLRDATAVLVMFKTGLRVNTMVQLENRHIDLNDDLLRLDGKIMKNHDDLMLPIDKTLHRLLSTLQKQNDVIRHAYHKDNSYVFITKIGDVIATGRTTNNIQKRMNVYKREYGLKNINPHALRRGFAKSLLDKGARLTDISKALGHSNLAVTTQYLHIDKEEVAENLRKFL